MSRRIRPKTACICCGTVGIHCGRGLIEACYARYKWRGTLDQFKPLGHTNRKKPAVGPDETVVPLALLGRLLADASPELEEQVERALGVGVVTLAVAAAEAQAGAGVTPLVSFPPPNPEVGHDKPKR